MELLEQVAAAMCRANGEDPEQVKSVSALRVFANSGDDDWGSYMLQARAAVEAMRLDCEGFSKLADRVWRDDRCVNTETHEGGWSVQDWNAMIDAALRP